MLKIRHRPQLRTLSLAGILVGASLLYLATLAPTRFGVQYDDGIYVASAKALATGQGYKIISLPSEPAQTKYPPLYPMLLSLIWRVNPHFPQNLIWMMLVSVAATVSFLALTYRYLVKQGYATSGQALIVVAMASVNLRITLLATTLTSEVPYLALSIAGLYLAEKYENQQNRALNGAILGLVLGLAFLTRSSGLALLVAVAVYYAIRREWKKSLLPISVGALCVVAWTVWCYANRTTAEGVNVAYYTDYWRVYKEVVDGLQTVSHESRLTIVLGIILKNVLGYVLVSVSVCSGVGYEWMQYFGFVFLLIAAGLIRQISKGLRLLHVYIIAYLALILPWPFTSYSRFLIPILPFLLLFIVVEVGTLITLVRRELSTTGQVMKKTSAAFIGLLLFMLISITLYNYGSDVYRSLASTSFKKVAGPPLEDAQAIEWINAHTNPSDVIICSRDPTYYLYTGRKATRSFAVNMTEAASFQSQQQGGDESNQLLRIIKESNGRYIVFTMSDFGYDSNGLGLNVVLGQYPQMFIPVFESTDERSRIYRIENSAGQ